MGLELDVKNLEIDMFVEQLVEWSRKRYILVDSGDTGSGQLILPP